MVTIDQELLEHAEKIARLFYREDFSEREWLTVRRDMLPHLIKEIMAFLRERDIDV